MTTYRKLLEVLKTLDAEQLDQTVTVRLEETDEYYSLCDKNPLLFAGPDNDVLDEKHFFINIFA